MKTRNVILTCAVAVAMLSVAVSASWAVPLLPVNDYNASGGSLAGGPGNTADPATGLGSVNYGYYVNPTEVTNAEYASFLNVVAKTDTYALYNPWMSADVRGGLNRAGAPGSYSYQVKPGMQNRPVTFVSWYDAVRYANFLTNQANLWTPSQLTESGAYTIANGAPDFGSVTLPTPAQRLIMADPKGQGGPNAPDPRYYLLPTENEWYKAAYYKGRNTNNLNAGYWTYPTQSNAPPTAQAPPGLAAAPGSADYNNAVPSPFLTTTAAYLGTFTPPNLYSPSKSAYGTSDQGGNVWEWTEKPDPANPLTNRNIRGGGYNSLAARLASGDMSYGLAGVGYANVGFRLVTVPEPSTLAMLLGSAALALVWWLRRRG